jgi:hypothetical protein
MRTNHWIHLVLNKSIDEDREQNRIKVERAENGISQIDNNPIWQIFAESIHEWLQTPTTGS